MKMTKNNKLLYIVMLFVLYTVIILSPNYNLACEAAELLDPRCNNALNATMTDFLSSDFMQSVLNGSFVSNPDFMSKLLPLCNANSTHPSDLDMDLCRCEAQLASRDEGFGERLTRPSKELKTVLNFISSNSEVAKSCGFDLRKNCPELIDSAIFRKLNPCLADAKEAMETCAPMIKASIENDQGDRPCCQALQTGHRLMSQKCTCSKYAEMPNTSNSAKIFTKEVNEFIDFATNPKSFGQACGGLTGNLFSGPACGEIKAKPIDTSKGVHYLLESRNTRVVDDCVGFAHSGRNACASTMEKVRKNSSDFVVNPLINAHSGCCLDSDTCRCDPIAVACCQKLGKLANGRESCWCKIKNDPSYDIPANAALIGFVRGIRRNEVLRSSCRRISSFQTHVCDYRGNGTNSYPRSNGIRKGFKKFSDNPP